MGDRLEQLKQGGETIVDGPFFNAVQVPDARLLVATRTSTPFETLQAVEQSFENLIGAFPYIRTHWRLLTDLRAAPMRTDSAFERVVLRYRPEIQRDFLAHAMLVKTAVGSLQVSRHAGQANSPALITQDVELALTHVGLDSTSARRKEREVAE